MDKLLFFAIIFMIISSGSVFAAVFFGKRFEQVLPINITAVVLIMLLFGISGALYTGVYAVLAVAALLWMLAGIGFVRNIRSSSGKTEATLSCIFSPGAVVYVLLAVFLIYTNYGRVPMIWDEFSHWADSVKAMATLDDFVTHPDSQSWFPSYPPGMALIQYLFVRLYMLVCGGVYVDWLLYYAYQLFLFSFLVCFVPVNWRERPYRALFCTGVLLLLPCLLYPSDVFVLSTTYIDPFLSVLMGCGLGKVFSAKEEGECRLTYVCCTIFMLVLSKAAGLLLGVFVAAGLVLVSFAEKHRVRRVLPSATAAVVSVFTPYLLWAIERNSSGINQSFSSKEGEVSLSMILRLINHTEESYRQLAYDNYWRELFRIGNQNCDNLLGMPLWLLLALVIFLLFFACRDLAGRPDCASGGIKAAPLLALLEITAYVVGLCFIFALKFEETEAIISMGQYRYICIVALAIIIFTCIITIKLVLQGVRCYLYVPIVALLLILQLPFPVLFRNLDRSSVEESLVHRAQFEQLIENINGFCMRGSDVYVVGQGRYTPNWQQIKYGVRPNKIQEDGLWMQLWENPKSEDVEPLSAEGWRKELVENFDYVAVFRYDQYFVNTYASVFCEETKIEENAVYSVDKESGLLSKIS